MAEMGKYCKAYLAKQFRAYPGWSENAANVRKEKKEVDGKEVEVDRMLDDDSILYLQENYVVTDGIFKDQNIIFDNVTDEWKQFCHRTSAFEIPVYEPIEIQRAEPGRDAGGQRLERPAPCGCENPAPAGSLLFGLALHSSAWTTPSSSASRPPATTPPAPCSTAPGGCSRRWSPASSPRTAPTAAWCPRSPRASTWPTGRR